MADGQVKDNRRRIRIFNYVVMVVGCTIGLVGLVDAIRDLAKNGPPKERLG